VLTGGAGISRGVGAGGLGRLAHWFALRHRDHVCVCVKRGGGRGYTYIQYLYPYPYLSISLYIYIYAYVNICNLHHRHPPSPLCSQVVLVLAEASEVEALSLMLTSAIAADVHNLLVAFTDPTLPGKLDTENTEGGLAITGGVHLVDVSALLPGGEVKYPLL